MPPLSSFSTGLLAGSQQWILPFYSLMAVILLNGRGCASMILRHSREAKISYENSSGMEVFQSLGQMALSDFMTLPM